MQQRTPCQGLALLMDPLMVLGFTLFEAEQKSQPLGWCTETSVSLQPLHQLYLRKRSDAYMLWYTARIYHKVQRLLSKHTLYDPTDVSKSSCIWIFVASVFNVRKFCICAALGPHLQAAFVCGCHQPLCIPIILNSNKKQGLQSV